MPENLRSSLAVHLCRPQLHIDATMGPSQSNERFQGARWGGKGRGRRGTLEALVQFRQAIIGAFQGLVRGGPQKSDSLGGPPQSARARPRSAPETPGRSPRELRESPQWRSHARARDSAAPGAPLKRTGGRRIIWASRTAPPRRPSLGPPRGVVDSPRAPRKAPLGATRPTRPRSPAPHRDRTPPPRPPRPFGRAPVRAVRTRGIPPAKYRAGPMLFPRLLYAVSGAPDFFRATPNSKMGRRFSGAPIFR